MISTISKDDVKNALAMLLSTIFAIGVAAGMAALMQSLGYHSHVSIGTVIVYAFSFIMLATIDDEATAVGLALGVSTAGTLLLHSLIHLVGGPSISQIGLSTFAIYFGTVIVTIGAIYVVVWINERLE